MSTRTLNRLFPLLLFAASAGAQTPPATPKPAPWTVKVVGPHASPVSGATVQLLSGGGDEVQAPETTDDRGLAKVQAPKAGSYLIRVRLAGFKSKEAPVRTGANGAEVPPVTITLEPL